MFLCHLVGGFCSHFFFFICVDHGCNYFVMVHLIIEYFDPKLLYLFANNTFATFALRMVPERTLSSCQALVVPP